MKLLVSACLTGINCKYNGGNNLSARLAAFAAGHEVITVCPEVLGGLPTPRLPSEISDGVVTMSDGSIVDEAFRRGAEAALALAKAHEADLIILQSRSPSCGVHEVYDGSFSGVRVPGMGVFARMAAEAGFAVMDVADLPDV